MIGIINYGLGNIKAFANVYKQLNIPAKLVTRPEELENISKIILPGVGSFDHAMDKLNHSGLRQMLDELVLYKKLPVIGICVGMQMLAHGSEEGSMPGLGWIDGKVLKFRQQNIAVPHMGWNSIKVALKNDLLKNLESYSKFYFLHSYYFKCQDVDNILASTDYFGEFSCVVRKENIYGVQFHPEKSHEWGIRLLKNFANL